VAWLEVKTGIVRELETTNRLLRAGVASVCESGDRFGRVGLQKRDRLTLAAIISAIQFSSLALE
jgi:hypothetical protein